jgi:hypothetical protein
MKSSLLALALGLCLSHQAFASGCLNESFYDLKAIAQSSESDACYFDKLVKMETPQSAADRQYNYFAEKVNEYAMVFGAPMLDSASFEFMFYKSVVKNSLPNSEAGKIDFTYEQSFNCTKQGETKKVISQIYVFGIVGLTGVCLSKNNISF